MTRLILFQLAWVVAAQCILTSCGTVCRNEPIIYIDGTEEVVMASGRTGTSCYVEALFRLAMTNTPADFRVPAHGNMPILHSHQRVDGILAKASFPRTDKWILAHVLTNGDEIEYLVEEDATIEVRNAVSQKERVGVLGNAEYHVSTKEYEVRVKGVIVLRLGSNPEAPTQPAPSSPPPSK